MVSIPAAAGSDEKVLDETAQRENQASTSRWAVRGAIVGGVAGATVGAGLAAVFARKPDARQALKEAVEGHGRQLAKAAAVAVGDVVASKSLKQLISSNGDDDRVRLVKETAKEAAAAAAQATRDTIVSVRREPDAEAA